MTMRDTMARRYGAHSLAEKGVNPVTQTIEDIAAESRDAVADGEPVSLDSVMGGVDPKAGDTTMEAALAETQLAVENAIKAANSTLGILKKALVTARTGQVRELRKALAAASEAATTLAGHTTEATEGFTFDEQAYLASGDYTRELLAAAEARGISMFEDDGRLLCYPSLVRVVSADAAVEIDKAKERRLRPSTLIDHLARNQEKAPRFKPDGFVDSLREAYDLIVARGAKKADGVVRLIEIWAVLTMLPGQKAKYPKQEFARDLYLLDQSGVRASSRNPRQLRLAASTGTKGAGVLVTVSRTGQRQRYWGVSFTPDENTETAEQ
jgi:hypothetical protein